MIIKQTDSAHTMPHSNRGQQDSVPPECVYQCEAASANRPELQGRWGADPHQGHEGYLPGPWRPRRGGRWVLDHQMRGAQQQFHASLDALLQLVTVINMPHEVLCM